MINNDVGFQIEQLSKRISTVERQLSEMKNSGLDNCDWDNSQLMRAWSISKRTAANYRKKGLGYYKRGGRIIYPIESREKFLTQNLDDEAKK